MNNKEIWRNHYWKVIKDGIKIAGIIFFSIAFLFSLAISFLSVYVYLKG